MRTIFAINIMAAVTEEIMQYAKNHISSDA